MKPHTGLNIAVAVVLAACFAAAWSAAQPAYENGGQTVNYNLASGGLVRWSNSPVLYAGAQDVALGRVAPNTLAVGNGTPGDASGVIRSAGLTMSGRTFTSGGECGETGLQGGAAAGQLIWNHAGLCTFSITIGNAVAAPHGWLCAVNFLTPLEGPGRRYFIHQSDSTPSTVKFTGDAPTGTALNFGCLAY